MASFFLWRQPGGPGTCESAANQKVSRPDHCRVLFSAFRPIAAPEEATVLDRINASNPDVVWVGLGLLKQESWIERHFQKIEAPWMIGVGAAFDFHAGTVKRAPVFYQKNGMEWLYRLAFEPRMLIRNLYSFMLILAALKERLRNRVGKMKKEDTHHV